MGFCLGDYGIINEIPSRYSIFTSEDTHIITINSIFFYENVNKLILKADNERKLFFKNQLNVFPSYNYDEYYKRISLIVI